MTDTLLGSEVVDVIADVVDREPSELLVVNPDEAVVGAVVSAVAAADERPNVRVLSDERTLKNVMGDFLVASNAADLIEAETLELRHAAELPQNAVLVTDAAVITLVHAGDRVGGLLAEDDGFVEAAREAYGEDWDAAEPFTLRTPGLSSVRESLAEEIGPEAREDFDAVLASLETARGDGDGLDEVTISLLVAAKNRVLLYDISRWGEDAGVASKATFSRTKTMLEDLGLIDTEKVPIDVGRPRLRLVLADDRLQDADASELTNVATSVIAS